MANFGGGFPDHRLNKAVANRILHGGRYGHVGVLTDCVHSYVLQTQGLGH